MSLPLQLALNLDTSTAGNELDHCEVGVATLKGSTPYSDGREKERKVAAAPKTTQFHCIL